MANKNIIIYALACLIVPIANIGNAHDGETHPKIKINVENTQDTQNELPFKLGGEFKLIDQFGNVRTNVDELNRPQILFFGYANCHSICGVAMPTIAQAIDILEKDKMDVLPIMITVDPKGDTQKIMKEKLKEIHPKFVGLNGDEKIIKKVWKKFGVQSNKQFSNEENENTYSHGSFIFILGPKGEVQSIMPPVVTANRLAEIVKKYNKNVN